MVGLADHRSCIILCGIIKETALAFRQGCVSQCEWVLTLSIFLRLCVEKVGFRVAKLP